MSLRSSAARAAAAGVLLAVAAAAGPPSSAEDSGSSAEALTPRAAAEEALRASPELRAARESIEAARGRPVQAGLWSNPELGLAGASDFAFANEGEGNAGVALEQRFPVAGRLARARDAARIEVEVARAEARDLARALIGSAEGEAVSILSLDR